MTFLFEKIILFVLLWFLLRFGSGDWYLCFFPATLYQTRYCTEGGIHWTLLCGEQTDGFECKTRQWWDISTASTFGHFCTFWLIPERWIPFRMPFLLRKMRKSRRKLLDWRIWPPSTRRSRRTLTPCRTCNQKLFPVMAPLPAMFLVKLPQNISQLVALLGMGIWFLRLNPRQHWVRKLVSSVSFHCGLVAWLIDRSIHGVLFDWLIDWLNVNSFGWLIDWLIDCPGARLNNCLLYCVVPSVLSCLKRKKKMTPTAVDISEHKRVKQTASSMPAESSASTVEPTATVSLPSHEPRNLPTSSAKSKHLLIPLTHKAFPTVTLTELLRFLRRPQGKTPMRGPSPGRIKSVKYPTEKLVSIGKT